MQISREIFFSVTVKDKAGALARVTAHLFDSGVDMAGLWGFGVGQGSANIIAVPRDVERFKEVAADAGWRIAEGLCFHLEGEDKPGALVEILNSVANEDVNLHAVDAISLDGHFGCYIWGEDEDIEIIAQVLGLSSPGL
jgi:hypothetical protein